MNTQIRLGEEEQNSSGDDNRDRAVVTRRAKLLRLALEETNRPARRLELLTRRGNIAAIIAGWFAGGALLCAMAAQFAAAWISGLAFYVLLACAAAALLAACILGRRAS